MKKENFLWTAVKLGLLGGAITIYLCLVGMVETFDKRDVIEGLITLGQFILLATIAIMGFMAARRTSYIAGKDIPRFKLTAGLVAGLVTGLVLSLFIYVGYQVNLREIFITASPVLYNILTFGRGESFFWVWLPIGAIGGLVGGAFLLVPNKFRRPITYALLVVFLLSLFAGLFRVVMLNQGVVIARTARFFFGQTGLTVQGALILFFAVFSFTYYWDARGKQVKARAAAMPKNSKRALQILLILLIAFIVIGLPRVSGPFIAQVIVTVILFILMGLGLNITLGFAGLLDLGFVAFYAIGAYTVGLLTSYGGYGLQHIPFWVAAPIAVAVAMLAGFILGLPVLGIRGDYLAIATLGFGEIVRLLAGSDFLAPYFGGPQGVIGIQKPCIGFLGPFERVDVPRICNGIELSSVETIYYLAVISVIVFAFAAWRLRESRLGRAWMAIREDEDVAEALGVNLIQTKLLAYMLGAAFAGLGGAIFATLIGSIFASSMQLIVSINVVALIVVGGMGSIPGVIVGAIFLIGMPELLREVSEFRYLFYGAALIVMMIAKPEGIWPSKAAKRELHHADAENVSAEGMV